MYVCISLLLSIRLSIHLSIYLSVTIRIYIYIYIYHVYIYIKGIYIYMYTPLSFCVLFIQLDTDRYRQIQILTWIQTKKTRLLLKKTTLPFAGGANLDGKVPKTQVFVETMSVSKTQALKTPRQGPHGKVPTARSPRQGRRFQAELEPKAKKQKLWRPDGKVTKNFPHKGFERKKGHTLPKDWRNKNWHTTP